MKRRIGLLLLIGIISITMLGCNKKGSGTSTGIWDDIINEKELSREIGDEEKKIFDEAIKTNDKTEYKPVALLAKQEKNGTSNIQAYIKTKIDNYIDDIYNLI